MRTTVVPGNRSGPPAGLLSARVAVLVSLALYGVAVRDAAAQDLPVESQVRNALEALSAGRIDEYLSHFLEGARVLIAYHEDDGGGTEVHPEDVRASLSALTWTPGELITQVFGANAVTVVDVAGALPQTGGGTIVGRWRYAELRTRVDGVWKIAQVDISPLPIDDDVTIARAVATSASAAVEPAPAPAPAPRIARASSIQPPAPDLPPGVPPAPVWPAVISRDDAGNATVRAIRLDGPLDVDGRLDEPVYSEVPPLNDFIQTLPLEGVPATELTEAWITYDEDNVYVSARVHEEVPESAWTANEMRRDANQVGNNDNFGLTFDTYYDRRNAYFFYTNPLGAMVDVQVTNEGSPNFDWNPVWDVRTGRFDGGWTVEVKLPFKSIRYAPGASQLWGVNLRRAIRRKNEWSHLTAVSRAAAGATGRNGIIRMSRAATLVGLEVPPTGLSLDVKPYGIASLTTDLSSNSALENEPDGDGGVDVKWGITQNLALDLTYNTDFAQVEVDEQQINLTRYSLTFPEKREFFLESRGIFSFPAAAPGGGGAGGGSAPQPFYSRRIGLEDGRLVPILGGGRLTGKVGPVDVGALSIQTEEVEDADALGNVTTFSPLTNFTVVRLRADVLARSNLGALFARRSRSLVADGSNETYGADALFAFFQDFYLSGFYARTQTRGISTDNQSYSARLSWDGDLQGFSATHLLVEDGFNPEVGLVRRSGFRQTQINVRASPRIADISFIRQVTVEGSADYLTNARQGYTETRDLTGRVGVEFENSDQLAGSYTESYERLVENERITGATIPAGRYSFQVMEASYSFGPQRFFSGSLAGRYGGFYEGDLYSIGFNRGRVEVFPQLSLEPSVSHNWVRLPDQEFNTLLAATRLTYTVTPRMFLSVLVQYNSASDRFSANARLRWEYRPGSEIFLVYTEERDTFDFERFPEMVNRGLVIKATSLLRL